MDRVIFLDIDGVLNCISSKSRCRGCIGIDNSKVKLLKQIVDNTNARIVLTSSWKKEWNKNLEKCDYDGKYLNNKLKKQGLYILDKTEDNGYNRGEGIYNWIKKYDIRHWVVLDDEIFKDYKKYGIKKHLVKTEFYNDNGGLQKEHIEKAISILNGEIK